MVWAFPRTWKGSLHEAFIEKIVQWIGCEAGRSDSLENLSSKISCTV